MLKTYKCGSSDFQAFFVSFVHVHNAICCKCGWMEKKALFHHIDTFVISRNNKLCSTEPSRYHALSQQRGLSEKKSIIAPPDMGLEPMTLRLKV